MKLKLLIFSGLILTATLGFKSISEDEYFQVIKSIEVFGEIFKELDANYVDEVKPDKLIGIGVNAMLSTLDPYSALIKERDLEDYRTSTTGEYGGIGAIIGRKRDSCMVLMPYEGAPAHLSGLEVADIFLEIDGQDVTKLNTGQISSKLKGKENTDVTIKVKRREEVKEFILTRKKIVVSNVAYSGMVKQEVGYIRLSDFTTNAGKEVKSALKALKKEGATKVVLDLRNNPGGLLGEAINVANIFIPKNLKVVETKGKTKLANKIYKSLNYPVDTLMPMAVLVNGYSASAAEIVAGVMQDYDRAVLIGGKTFGKGLVQSTRPLPYNAQLKLTTAKYYIPSGRCIQAIDYGATNDGKGKLIADSLKMAFNTKNKRVVFDGGGVQPDIKAERNKLNEFVLNLLSKDMIFRFATLYPLNDVQIDNTSIALPDSIFMQFRNWLKNSEFDYKSRKKVVFDKIIAELDGVSSEELDEHLTELNNAFVSNLDVKLENNKDLIRFLLKEEYASRKLLQKGMIATSFDRDEVLDSAVAILTNTSRYSALLNTN